MAVETLYRSSRDPEKIFMDKNEADLHDKMLELAEVLMTTFKKAVPSLNEQHAEDLGIFMAKNREIFAKAFGKKAEILLDLFNPPASEGGGAERPESAVVAEIKVASEVA